MSKILYINNNDFHNLGRSQMNAGGCYVFRPSKPHSGTLWSTFYNNITYLTFDPGDPRGAGHCAGPGHPQPRHHHQDPGGRPGVSTHGPPAGGGHQHLGHDILGHARGGEWPRVFLPGKFVGRGNTAATVVTSLCVRRCGCGRPRTRRW